GRRRRRREPGDDPARRGERGGADRAGAAHPARDRLGHREGGRAGGGLRAAAGAGRRSAAPPVPSRPARSGGGGGAAPAGHLAHRPHRPAHRQRHRRRGGARPRRAPGAGPQPPYGYPRPRRGAALRALRTLPRRARPGSGEGRMSTDRAPSPDPRDVDAEFGRMRERGGLDLRPGEAPRALAAPERPRPSDGSSPAAEAASLWSFSADSPPQPPSPESIARSRAAHPSAGGPVPPASPRGQAGPRELDDDEVLYGDFEQPDPDLPTPSDAAMWAWTALLGGFVLMLVVALTPTLPGVLGWLGGLAALGGMVALLLRAPRRRRDDGDDGAEV